jgi:hypothetical protein
MVSRPAQRGHLAAARPYILLAAQRDNPCYGFRRCWTQRLAHR